MADPCSVPNKENDTGFPDPPNLNFSKLQDLSSVLRDISMNVPVAASKDNASFNSSLGILPDEKITGNDSSTIGFGSLGNDDTSADISLGKYLQPAALPISSPFPSSDETNASSVNPSPVNFSAPHEFVKPQIPPPNFQQSICVSKDVNEALGVGAIYSSNGDNGTCMTAAQNESSSGFPWDKIVNGNDTHDISNYQKQLSFNISTNTWDPSPQDPSFCSGKFSARSTSFGGEYNTRDENFSDFGTVPSFQSSGSFVSNDGNSKLTEDSVFQSGFPVQSVSEGFFGFDAQSQAELGVQFSDNEFGSLGKEQLKNFLDQEEAECLQANPFIEEEQCDEPSNSSMFSGVSDKSIMLRNSNLWGGDTSKVNLDKLKADHHLKVSRCEYFRHNSSRLGSLEESMSDTERPGLGFVHHIRSPERKPYALLSSKSPEKEPKTLSSTFNMVNIDAKSNDDVVGISSETDSGPNSANSTYIGSGNSTKTVVSVMDQSATLKAAELANRLQTLVGQIDDEKPRYASYSGIAEESGEQINVTNAESINSKLDGSEEITEDINASIDQIATSIRDSLGSNGGDIDISMISKALSDASLSNDPKHFVNILMERLKGKKHEDDCNKIVSNREDSGISEESTNFPEGNGHPPTETRTPVADSKSATLPRMGRMSGHTNASRLSKTPTSTMTPSMSKRAMMRLTPSSAEPSQRTRVSIDPKQSNTKPIKPFGVTKPTSQACVAPVRPQQQQYDPASLLVKQPIKSAMSKTTPTTAGNSNVETRRMSGTRHSSPIKKVVTIKSPTSNMTFTPPSDLASLLDAANTPCMNVASSSHITTSTPFHNGHNLSTVILDHLTQNDSISPLVNPEASLSPAKLDVSTISPALYTSLLKPVHHSPRSGQELHLPPQASLDLHQDWYCDNVFCSHVKQYVSVPVHHNLLQNANILVKVTTIWVGGILVPSNLWGELVQMEWEKVESFNVTQKCFDIEFKTMKAGSFTFSVSIVLENGWSSNGLVRLNVEDPNIQVLTESGSKLDFGYVPENCSLSAPIVFVNCGASSVPISLSIKAPNDRFSFISGEKTCSFVIPGVENNSDGKGVAKEVEVLANSIGIRVNKPTILVSELVVGLGDDNFISLGNVGVQVCVGNALLNLDKVPDPIMFHCQLGESITRSIILRNTGNIPMKVAVTFDIDNLFSSDKYIQIPPNNEFKLPISYKCSSEAFGEKCYIMNLSVLPNGPNHVLNLKTKVDSIETDPEFKSSKPGLSFGLIKRSSRPEMPSPVMDEVPTVFPVFSDRSLVNFFSVPVGGREEQVITLKNNTEETVNLNLIIRESDRFFISAHQGSVTSSQLTLPAKATQDVKIIFCPNLLRTEKAKLVLKPQGRNYAGKAIKASIFLCGMSGSSNICIEGVEEIGQNQFQLQYSNICSNVVKVFNKGDSTGFVRLVLQEDLGNASVKINPPAFLLEAGGFREVYITTSHEKSSSDSFSLLIFTGPELIRQMAKKVRLAVGAARININPALIEIYSGEEHMTKDAFNGQVLPVDIKQFYQKTAKLNLSLVRMSSPTHLQYDNLDVEETLSATRIDQSIITHTNMDSLRSQKKSNEDLTSELRKTNITPSMILLPSKLNLAPGEEALVHLVNNSSDSQHWDLAWANSRMTITPGSGRLEPNARAAVCVRASDQGGWKGDIRVYTDNDVHILPVSISAPILSVNTSCVDIGMTVIGSSSSSSLVLSNSSQNLVQWVCQLTPSFFSLPVSGGLLNPAQSVPLSVMFKPAAPGSHRATLSFLMVNMESGKHSSPAVSVDLKGTAMMPSAVQHNSGGKKVSGKPSGTVSLESELVIFPNTVVGEMSVAKVKIKNRSGYDHTVDILPPPTTSPFRTVHSVLDVKNQCYCTLPLQFKPTVVGDASAEVRFQLPSGIILTAVLKGKGL